VIKEETIAVDSLKTGHKEAFGVVDTQERAAVGEGGGRVLACAKCLADITTVDARIEVGGHHEHHFTNPDGYKFHIGCFSRAPGCRGSGAPSNEATWFTGYSWQVEGCTQCGEFLGWRYRSGEHRFHGLILARLVELEPGGPSPS
jgi:hypothetical protein